MLRHLFAFVGTVTAAVVVAFAGYAAIFVVAAVAGESVGSPLNFVIVPAMAALSVGAVTMFVVLPLAIAFSLVCRAWRVHLIIPPILVLVTSVATIVGETMHAGRYFDQPLSFPNVRRLVALVMFVAGPSFVVYWSILQLKWRRLSVLSNSA